MYDSSQFVLPHGVIQRYFAHEGVVGRGRDYLTGTPCVIHLYIDPQTNKKYALQLYQNITTEFHDRKLEALVKTVTAESMPNFTRVIFLTSKKSKTGNQLAAMYDVSELYGMSLENLLTARLKNGELFKQQQVVEFLSQILDAVYFSGSRNGEYLELTPINIFVKMEPKHRYRYFPNNFGMNFAGTKWQKKYHNPKEEWPPNTLVKGLKQTVFMVGLIALQMCTLQDPNSLYSGGKHIDEKLLNKALEGIKLNFPPELFKLISGMCSLNPQSRLSLEDIYSKDGYLLKSRKVKFLQGKLGTFKRFSGFVVGNQEIESFAQTTNDKLELYRGSYQAGKQHGYGIHDKQNNIYIGQFVKGQFKYGICIIRNHCVLLGTFQNGNPVKVTQFMLNIHSLTSNDNCLYFNGKMNCLFEREQGRLVQKDGSVYQGQFVNGKRNGVARYTKPVGKIVIQGKWENDQLEGNATYIAEGVKYDAIYKNGKQQSKRPL